jgi:hypothetical protein
VQGKPVIVAEPLVINIDGTGRMTRSGRVFAPKSPQENVEVLVMPMAKVTPASNVETEVSKEKGPQNEVDEFIRIVRKSDYKVVD